MGFPVTVNGNTYTEAMFLDYGYQTALPDMIADTATVAGDADTDATAAAASAGAAATSASNASTSASNAATSASNAATSETNAQTYANAYGAVFVATSTTSNTIGTGSKSFTVVEATQRAFAVGQSIRVARTSAPTTTYMDGVVTAYSHPSLTINVVTSTGSGTHTDWTLSVQAGAAAGATAWAVKTTTYTAVAGDRLLNDTSGGPWSLTLPASAVLGDTIESVDYAGTFATNNLTILRNGHKIMGLSEDLTVSTNNAAFRLIYSGAAYGWRLA